MAVLDDRDLKAIKSLVEITIEDKGLVAKEDLNHLPTKDGFYEQTTEILKRLDNLEEEKDVLSHRVTENEDRIEEMENKLNLSAS